MLVSECFSLLQIFIQKSTVQEAILQLPFESAWSLSNKRQNKILQNTSNNTLHVMSCEDSCRQEGRRQAVMVFNAASLRDFAAFRFCPLPSFTVVHPSVHHRFTLSRR
jgi:hypothetical protein